MGFRRLLGTFGVGGPSVETVLATSQVRPGDRLAGEVRITGGEHEVHIHQVVLGLVTRSEDEYGDEEAGGTREFHRGAITGAFLLGAGQHHAIPFQMPLPWELPVTEVYGQHLHGMAMGVRTELEVAGAVDAGDIDPVSVVPLPSQQRVLDAFGALGFGFKSADVEEGHIAGVHQELPFYQEIEFYAPPRYGGQINEVELTFVTDPHGLVVILEADRRGNMFSEGEDVFGRFHVSHEEALRTTWEHELERWLGAVAGHHGGHGLAHHAPHDTYGHHGEHSGGHGPGWGGVAAGAVGGVAAGFVAGAVVNEMLDDDDESDEEPSVGDVFAEAAEDAVQDAYRQAAYEQAYEDAYQDAYEDAREDAAESSGEEFEGEE
ncbi:sporulation protein [Actinomadura chibensis]|uniref:Sporulation protein n=1 Tax=Actinomadura chibensis TaxID=392828 RepID=A0A5D0NNK1_9ACTN|nr:sporulation protein [Actinomadura chibensis]TYB45601.1 sporulation protein [Actinomadura chibensis]